MLSTSSKLSSLFNSQGQGVLDFSQAKEMAHGGERFVAHVIPDFNLGF
jgi:hypothetical protein